MFERLMLIRVASRHLAAQSQKLDPKTKRLVNATLIRSGMDGNKRFRKPGEALARISEVLSDFGIEWDEVLPSFRLSQPKGRITVDLAFSNEEDPFSPMPIENTTLAFHWDTLGTGVEAIAYLG